MNPEDRERLSIGCGMCVYYLVVRYALYAFFHELFSRDVSVPCSSVAHFSDYLTPAAPEVALNHAAASTATCLATRACTRAVARDSSIVVSGHTSTPTPVNLSIGVPSYEITEELAWLADGGCGTNAVPSTLE